VYVCWCTCVVGVCMLMYVDWGEEGVELAMVLCVNWVNYDYNGRMVLGWRMILDG